MRITYLTPFFKPYDIGGAEISTYLYAKELSKRQRVLVLTPNYGSLRWKEEKENPNFIICRFPFPVRFVSKVSGFFENIIFTFYLALITIYFIIRYKVEIIHIQHDLFIPGGGLAANLLNKPYLITIRAHGFLCNLGACPKLKMEKCTFPAYLRCLWRKLGKLKILFPVIALFYKLNLRFRLLFYRKANLLVGVSNYMEKRVVEELGIKREKATTVYNLIPPKFSNKTVKKEKNVFLYVGRLCQPKGVDILLESIKMVLERRPKIRFWFIGNGRRRHYKTIAEKLGIGEKVKFFGWLPHKKVEEFYLKSDVVILPSIRQEPLSRVLIEAGMLGKAIITTNTGGSPEVIKNMQTGLLVKPYSKDLAWAMKFMIENPEKKKKFGKNVKKLVKELFNQRVNVQKLEEIYRGCLRK